MVNNNNNNETTANNMPPKESDHLLLPSASPSPSASSSPKSFTRFFSFGDDEERMYERLSRHQKRVIYIVVGLTVILGLATFALVKVTKPTSTITTIPPPIITPSGQYKLYNNGTYRLVERQTGQKFADFYKFYDGDDSLGSAGYNTYVSENEARKLGIYEVVTDDEDESTSSSFVYLRSSTTKQGPMNSIRLEGIRRFDSGLFILDVDHIPVGCGQWPAFWLTDESNWPKHGEIDIVEGINYQTNAKTALHTSDKCSMYANVPDYAKTGSWDRSTGLPDRYTGQPDLKTNVPADNCWNLAPHQWQNQGCVAISDRNDTLGQPINNNGGGIYALQWDPTNHYIRSWVFPKANGIPSNLHNVLVDNGNNDETNNAEVIPDPDTWGLPYGYFAIGENTGCSADHFQNMHIVLNTAFCGTVAGNRFFRDCPHEITKTFNVSNDPVRSCNAYIASEPKELDEAYWKIRGVYVYQRSPTTK